MIGEPFLYSAFRPYVFHCLNGLIATCLRTEMNNEKWIMDPRVLKSRCEVIFLLVAFIKPAWNVTFKNI